MKKRHPETHPSTSPQPAVHAPFRDAWTTDSSPADPAQPDDPTPPSADSTQLTQSTESTQLTLPPSPTLPPSDALPRRSPTEAGPHAPPSPLPARPPRARNGKIARLPYLIRTALNQRILNGEQAKSILEWLNFEPEVHDIVNVYFGGSPVNEQNLTEWRQGGYQDWLRQEESRALVRSLAEQKKGLIAAADGPEISDLFAAALSAQLISLAGKLLDEKTDLNEKWQCLREVLRELSQLRRDDHRAVRTALARRRSEHDTFS